MAWNLSYLKRRTGLLKLAQIITVVVAFGLFRGGKLFFKPEANVNILGIGMLVTAMLVTPLLLICHLVDNMEKLNTLFEIIFNFIMFICLLITGSFCIEFWSSEHPYVNWFAEDRTMALAKGSMCVLASLAYLTDSVLLFLEYRQHMRSIGDRNRLVEEY